MTAHAIDDLARGIIRDAGYGDYFTHRLGHGIGLSAHEEPYMMQRNQLVLKPAWPLLWSRYLCAGCCWCSYRG